ncbi:MAG: hypothetical protein OXH50_15560 [Gemmatimonadetes bacterium]|nr:hypothetical protein [Gemmatimonadota bacterium]
MGNRFDYFGAVEYLVGNAVGINYKSSPSGEHCRKSRFASANVPRDSDKMDRHRRAIAVSPGGLG